jgi:hypothetical protein
MSLWTVVNGSTPRSRKLRQFLKTNFPTPTLGGNRAIKVFPATKNYLLIGTAFDYLLRFSLQRKFKRKVRSRTLVADSAIKSIRRRKEMILSTTSLEEVDEVTLLKKFDDHRKLSEYIVNRFKASKLIYRKYVSGSRVKKEEIIQTCLFLSRLDAVYRSGPRVMNEINWTSDAIEDISELKSLLKSCSLSFFKPKRKIILNPTFGHGSSVVVNADADLIVDDLLIDIKVTKEFKLTRPIFNQLVGYYLLYLIGGINGNKNIKIKRLGIFFARHNFLWTIDVDALGDAASFEKAVKKLKQSVGRRF